MVKFVTNPKDIFNNAKYVSKINNKSQKWFNRLLMMTFLGFELLTACKKVITTRYKNSDSDSKNIRKELN